VRTGFKAGAIEKKNWNIAKGAARPNNAALKHLNNYLEEVRARIVSYYQQLNLTGEYIVVLFLF